MRTRGRDRGRETEAESHQISHRFKRMKTTWRNQEKAKGKMEEKKYLKWYNKVGYGSGDMAGNVVYSFLSSFIMIYLTNIVGLNAGIVGTLIAVSKLFDGVTDIFFGAMIDKTKSRLGKARPWMLYAYIGCLGEGYVNLEDGLYVQDAKTNDLVVDVYDKDEDVKTPFWSGVEFYNKLYREGLLDPDNFITQGEDLTEKYTKGQYLGGTVNWFYGTYNTNNKGTDKEYIALPSKLGWVNEPNKAGWTGKYLFVSSHSPNIERAVMVLDYLQSSEFARSAESGIEGRWEKGDDGKPHLTEDTMSMKTDSSRADEWKASGISDSGTDNLVGWDYNDVLPDGGLVNLWNDEDVMKANLTTAEQDLCKQFDIDLPSDLLKKRIEDGTSMDLSDANPTIRMYLEITPKNITRIDSNCIELTENALPGLVQAESDEAFQSAKEALLQQLADAGVEESIEWWQNAWETSKSSIDKLESK